MTGQDTEHHAASRRATPAGRGWDLERNLPWLVIGLGLLIAYAPSFWQLRHLWSSDEQGHGPIIAAISGWLIWKHWPAIADPSGDKPAVASGFGVLLIACLLYVLGRSQSVQFFEIGSLIPMLAAVLLILRGPRHLKLIWFPLFFMCFMVPLPAALVAALTGPMKIAVSYMTELALHGVGYPVSRSGVILQVGQYQLLVADACAGMHTLLTLEALGLLYLNLVKSASVVRNVTLAILVVPISFAANVIRVIVLSLITYHFGDEAGQGFLHGFAGMVLFMTSLALIITTDTVLTKLFVSKPGSSSQKVHA